MKVKFRVNDYKQDIIQLSNLFDLDDIEGNWDSLQELIRVEDYRFYTAHNGNSLIGHSMVAVSDSNWRKETPAILESLYVKEDHRGQGIGKQFLQFILKDLSDYLTDSGLILYVKTDNLPAIALYKSTKFVIEQMVYHKAAFGDSYYCMKLMR